VLFLSKQGSRDDLLFFLCFRFHPVVGGGANGSVIHYSRNDKKVHQSFSLVVLTSQILLSRKVDFSCLIDQNR
jgi:Xaa-Pro aminopeptidase